ncbi:MAG: CheR family methyltransferase [bacterium]
MNPSLVQQACELISKWSAFDLRSMAPRRIRDFVVRRSAALGYPSPSSYLAELAEASPSDPEPQRLINLVTNGLTHFWRDEPQLDALRYSLSEVSTRVKGRPVRVWCVGCSTGEEAYTVAMVARELQVAVKVLGTDINTEGLSHAALGRYSQWSLRKLEDRRRNQHFRQHENQWEVSDVLMRSVEFRRHNVVERPPDTPLTWDVVICRNVLIYLHEAAKERVAENFAIALDQDGYLILGSSEQLMGGEELFRASKKEGGFVYRHLDKAPGTTQPLILDLEEESIPVLIAEGLAKTQEIEDDAAVVHLVSSGLGQLATNPESALACFEAAACYDPFVLETYIHIARALAEAPERATEALQKALFLDPYQWYAAYEAGRIYEACGERRRAKIAYAQALEGIEQRTTTLFDERLVDAPLLSVESKKSTIHALCTAGLERLA